MKITIEIDTENDIFEDKVGGLNEVWRLLNISWQTVEMHWSDVFAWEARLIDQNGNRCGFIRGEYDNG